LLLLKISRFDEEVELLVEHTVVVLEGEQELVLCLGVVEVAVELVISLGVIMIVVDRNQREAYRFLNIADGVEALDISMRHSGHELVGSFDDVEQMNPSEQVLKWLAANQNFVDPLVEEESLERLPDHFNVLSDVHVMHIRFELHFTPFLPELLSLHLELFPPLPALPIVA
jgi:hypothetical protein